ncbi:hypothetical protein NDU88_006631 [Pleurodeles waltl]|uniref:BZIP domain-containing protein n=1 Tax=Pleurodeles waltl TaxID=8319 RepID=A0AAV7PLZ2_PLEWA|nr:hypothetical protein NDU88_006631 [Pleurodeles waltl]
MPPIVVDNGPLCTPLVGCHSCFSKFNPKRAPVRQACCVSTFQMRNPNIKLSELSLDYGPPKVCLSHHKYVFQQGQWMQESTTPRSHRPQDKKLRARNKALREENNYLKLQLELVMDMLTEATARVHTLEGKLEQYPEKEELGDNVRVVMMPPKDEVSPGRTISANRRAKHANENTNN